MRLYTTEIDVRYGETDKMGVAHHTAYLLWFEIGRTGLLRESGHSYRGLEEDGLMLPVLECHVEFRVGAEYDDRVEIETAVTDLKSRTVTFSYRALRNGSVLATGWTRHLCVGADNRPRRIPEPVLKSLAAYATVDNPAPAASADRA